MLTVSRPVDGGRWWKSFVSKSPCYFMLFWGEDVLHFFPWTATPMRYDYGQFALLLQARDDMRVVVENLPLWRRDALHDNVAKYYTDPSTHRSGS